MADLEDVVRRHLGANQAARQSALSQMSGVIDAIRQGRFYEIPDDDRATEPGGEIQGRELPATAGQAPDSESTDGPPDAR